MIASFVWLTKTGAQRGNLSKDFFVVVDNLTERNLTAQSAELERLTEKGTHSILPHPSEPFWEGTFIIRPSVGTAGILSITSAIVIMVMPVEILLTYLYCSISQPSNFLSTYQCPFKKAKGLIQRVLFNPTRPFLFVAVS